MKVSGFNAWNSYTARYVIFLGEKRVIQFDVPSEIITAYKTFKILGSEKFNVQYGSKYSMRVGVGTLVTEDTRELRPMDSVATLLRTKEGYL